MDKELGAIREKKLRDLMNEINKAKNKENWPEEPVEITDSTFESTVQQYDLLVVDCWAPWCGPCKMIAPTIKALAKEYKGKAVFGKLNTDENITIATKFSIMSIPTLLFFKNGELVDKLIGAVPRQFIEEKLQQLI